MRCANLEHSNQQACRQQKCAVFANQANTQTHRVLQNVRISAAPCIQNRGCQSLTTGWCQPTTVTAISGFGSRAIHHQFALNVKRLNGVRAGSVKKVVEKATRPLPAQTARLVTFGHLDHLLIKKRKIEMSGSFQRSVSNYFNLKKIRSPACCVMRSSRRPLRRHVVAAAATVVVLL